MNDKIKELMLEAGYAAPEIAKRAHVLAELLVLECINTVMDGTREGDYYAMRIEHHFDNGPGGILHFGVEE